MTFNFKSVFYASGTVLSMSNVTPAQEMRLGGEQKSKIQPVMDAFKHSNHLQN